MQPIRFRCPECQQSLRVSAEKAGRKVRCNRCAAVLAVPEQSPPEPADEPPVAETQAPAPRTRTAAPKLARRRSDESTKDALRLDEDDTEGPAADGPKKKRKPKGNRRAGLWRLPRLGLLLLMVGTVLSFLVQVGFQLVFQFMAPTSLSGMNTLRSLTAVTIAVTAGIALLNVAGFALGLFAPRDSGVRPFAIATLIAVVLSTCMTAYLTWLPNTLFDPVDFEVPDQKQLKNKEDLDKFVRKMEEQSQRVQKNLKGFQARMAIVSTIGSLLHGLYLISVPLFLRSICRALRLTELEPNCDGLLKIGAGMIALELVGRLLIGMLILSLLTPFVWLSLAVHLAWQGLLWVLTFQIWRAMPATR